MDADFIRDLFSNFRPVEVRRMFSGVGIFADGLMFALVVDGVIYLKAGEENAPDFDREDLPPFQYRRKAGHRAVMSYRRMPERLYDDPEELAVWAQKALRAAAANARPKPAKKAAAKKPKAAREKARVRP